MAEETKIAPEGPSSDTRASKENLGKAAPKKSLFLSLVRHWRLVGVLLLIAAIFGTYAWKNIAVSRAKAQLTLQAGQVISDQTKTYLRLAAIPLVWVVRGEMMRGNYEQLNQYLAQFVREPNMKEILVARADGRVAAATDKRREGARLGDLFPPEVLRADTISVTTRESGDFMVAAPVMGLNEKLGVLVVIASPTAYSLEAPSR